MRPSKFKIAMLFLSVPLASGLSCPSSFQFGNPTAWTQRTVNNSAALRPTAVEATDFDGDNRLDIVAGYQGEGAVNPAVFIFFQEDINTFTAVQLASHADLVGLASLAVADICCVALGAILGAGGVTVTVAPR